MVYNFNEEQKAVIEMVHELCERQIGPLAAEIDETERFPEENWHALAEMGLMGMIIPEEYGGAGLDYVTYIGVGEEISKYCMSTSAMMGAHTGLCCWPLLTYGTEEQKQKYLVPLASGEKLGAFALTEPNAGSDAASQKTTAVLDGDCYVLNGTKAFITNAEYASTFVVMAMTNRELGVKGITAFIVEKGTPGFTVGAHEKKMGIRGSSTCELSFDNCRIPKENVLGQEGMGFKIAMSALDGGRIACAGQACGVSQAAIDGAIKYTGERVQFGKKLNQFQNTQFELADVQANVDAARALTYTAAAAKDRGERITLLAAEAKLFASKTASDATRRMLQIVGGFGYTREYPFERYMRDSKITEIYEGTSEVQKMVISGWMLK